MCSHAGRTRVTTRMLSVACYMRVQGLSQEVLGSQECQQVVSMQQALESGNWSAFLKLATSAPYLQGCLAHMYYQGVRARALNVIVAAGWMQGTPGAVAVQDACTQGIHLMCLYV